MAYILLGSQPKYEITMPRFGGISLKNTQWGLHVSAQNSYEFLKNEVIMVSDEVIEVVVDTDRIGCGKIKFSLEIEVPDRNMTNGIRREIPYFETEDVVVRWSSLR